VHPFLLATLGGVLIGLAASWLWLADGRIAGISGIAAGAADPRVEDRGWRIAFLLGLVGVGLVAAQIAPENFSASFGTGPRGWVLLVVSGLLVGVGTRLGGGCTSGHGVCGISRFSVRSLTATGIFMVTAAVSLFVLRHSGVFP
jgi:uncharacterized membrane protein YedE/YeeE